LGEGEDEKLDLEPIVESACSAQDVPADQVVQAVRLGIEQSAEVAALFN